MPNGQQSVDISSGFIPKGGSVDISGGFVSKDRSIGSYGEADSRGGYMSAVREGLSGLGPALLSMLDPTRGLSGAGLTAVGLNPREGGVSERLGETPIAGAIRETIGAYNQPDRSWLETLAAGPGALVGMSAERARQRAREGDTAGILGQATVPTALTLAGPAMQGIGRLGIGDALRTTLQRYATVGPEMTERAIADRAAQVAEIEADNHEALTRSRSSYEAKERSYQDQLAAVRATNQEARNVQMQKQQLMGEIQGHAADLAERLPALRSKVVADGKAMYPAIEGTVDSGAIRNLISDSIGALRGTEKPPSVLSNMLKDLEPENPLAQASVFRGAGSQARGIRGGTPLLDLPPSVRERILPTLSIEERAMYQPPVERGGYTESLDFERLHGYATELGEELNRDLSGDERAAITQTRAGILNMMRRMADNEGKLPQFAKAQKNWAQLENTFNKTAADRRGVASPIAKALAAKDPVTGKVIPERLASILLKDTNYKTAQEMLQRYGGEGSDALQLLKEKADQIASMPKHLKELPEPHGPTLALISKLKELPPDVDPQALKTQALQESAQGLRSMKGIRGALDIVAIIHFLSTGNPMGLAYPIARRAASYGLEAKPVMRYLSKPAAAERAIATRQVYPSKAAAYRAKNKP